MSAPSASDTYLVELLKRRWLSPRVFEIELTRPPSFDFTPGQRIRFLYDGVEKDYSLISAPDDATLALCIRQVEAGIFSPVLASARIGARFRLTGPYGYFTYRPSGRSSVFVATGTGIAPFVSMGRSGTSGFTLLHGVQGPEDLLYESFFRSVAHCYVPCLSNASADMPVPPGTFCGRATAYLRTRLPRASHDFYLCGRREMIRDVTHLVDEEFPGSMVYTEIFH